MKKMRVLGGPPETGFTELVGLDCASLAAWLGRWGERPYRAAQLYEAIYRGRRRHPAEISTLPAALRARLEAEARITWPAVEKRFLSTDGTIRYLLRLSGDGEDPETIETVLMPEDDRDTICISTQAGCAVNCRFCLTALVGLKRNLSAAEIVGQTLLVIEENGLGMDGARARPVNVVFMGMGEPLLNYDPVMAAVRLMADPKGMGLATRRMTLSTAGIVPRLADLGREPVRPNLAVSLNASTDQQRTAIIPHNRKWPIAALLEACRRFPLRPRESLTFEYVLFDSPDGSPFNDSEDDARRVVKLLAGMRAKVNLIALNPGAELPFRTPSDERVLAFQKILVDSGLLAFIRRPRGRDIFAACGQLKRVSDPAHDLALLGGD